MLTRLFFICTFIQVIAFHHGTKNVPRVPKAHVQVVVFINVARAGCAAQSQIRVGAATAIIQRFWGGQHIICGALFQKTVNSRRLPGRVVGSARASLYSENPPQAVYIYRQKTWLFHQFRRTQYQVGPNRGNFAGKYYCCIVS